MRFKIDRASNLFGLMQPEPPTTAVECIADKEKDGWYCEIETIEQLKEISLKEDRDLIIRFDENESVGSSILIYDDYIE